MSSSIYNTLRGFTLLNGHIIATNEVVETARVCIIILFLITNIEIMEEKKKKESHPHSFIYVHVGRSKRPHKM